MSSPPTATGLRVGFVPGVTLTKWRTIWQQRFPGTALEVVAVGEEEQARALMDARVDMCFVRLPVAEGLHVITLYDEVPVAWMAADHPLAAFDEVTSTQLGAGTVLQVVDPGNLVLVAVGEAVLRVPLSVARSHNRRDLVYRPVTDAPGTTIALAWRADHDNAWIDEFIGVVRGRTETSSRTAQARSAAAAPGRGRTRRDPSTSRHGRRGRRRPPRR